MSAPHLTLYFLFVAAGLVLNEFIRHFEPAVYDRDALMTQHKRLRRDAASTSPPLNLHIKANSRYVPSFFHKTVSLCCRLLSSCSE
jgi:hypothetical protein